MDGLDLLGAAGLADQIITVRVKNIDTVKLRNKIGGSKGAIASSAIQMVDVSPRAALDAAVPIAVSKAREYGIDADVVVSDVPPQTRTRRAVSEFWPGLGLGLVVGATGLLIVKGVRALIGR